MTRLRFDILVTIDNAAADRLYGNAGRDVFWTDQTETAQDLVESLQADDTLQAVKAFANGADRTLNGDAIADPKGETYASFRDKPLFAQDGPKADDIHQGAIGDCPTLASMAAIAHQNPQVVRRAMVDLGDGTFGVRLGDEFYRVDADLPVSYSPVVPKYAGLGREDSLWAALVEKALVLQQIGSDVWSWGSEYNAITRVGTRGVYTAFNASRCVIHRTPAQCSSVDAFLGDLYEQWTNRRSVSVVIGVTSDVPLIGGHSHTLIAMTRDAHGNVTTITLRNPWGVDGTDNPSDPNDGLVTVSASQFLKAVCSASWGVFSA